MIFEDIQEEVETKPCNCEKSKCLKLYCECFAKNKMCTQTCNCRDCKNNGMFKEERQRAILQTLEKNPNAFNKLYGNSNGMNSGAPQKGCTCKKSNCLKNYCECYQKGQICTHLCKCVGCYNNYFFQWNYFNENNQNQVKNDPTSNFLTENNFGFAVGVNLGDKS